MGSYRARNDIIIARAVTAAAGLALPHVQDHVVWAAHSIMMSFSDCVRVARSIWVLSEAASRMRFTKSW